MLKIRQNQIHKLEDHAYAAVVDNLVTDIEGLYPAVCLQLGELKVRSLTEQAISCSLDYGMNTRTGGLSILICFFEHGEDFEDSCSWARPILNSPRLEEVKIESLLDASDDAALDCQDCGTPL